MRGRRIHLSLLEFATHADGRSSSSVSDTQKDSDCAGRKGSHGAARFRRAPQLHSGGARFSGCATWSSFKLWAQRSGASCRKPLTVHCNLRTLRLGVRMFDVPRTAIRFGSDRCDRLDPADPSDSTSTQQTPGTNARAYRRINVSGKRKVNTLVRTEYSTARSIPINARTLVRKRGHH